MSYYKVNIIGRPGGSVRLDRYGYFTLRDRKHVVLYEPPNLGDTPILSAEVTNTDLTLNTVTLVKCAERSDGTFDCRVSAGDVTKLGRYRPPGLSELQISALHNVRERMRKAEPYKEIWSAEFITIELLLEALSMARKEMDKGYDPRLTYPDESKVQFINEVFNELTS